MDKHKLTELIRSQAIQLGFAGLGVAKAEMLSKEADFLEKWLSEKRHGSMQYMERYFELRTNPEALLTGTKSVIVLSYNYYTSKQQKAGVPKVAMYALGGDYHLLIRKKLNRLCDYITSITGSSNLRSFVDSGPVMERAWAQRAGLGWQGKNTLILTKQAGSYFFLATIFSDLELEYDKPVKDYCGRCTKCIDACPTQAIYEPYKLDASRCISYLTIENREPQIAAEYQDKLDGWIFGCDVCQQVCPINSQAEEHNEPFFLPLDAIMNMSREEWLALSEQRFKELFSHSPLKRAKFSGIKRNVSCLQQ